MNTRPLPLDTSSQDLKFLADIDYAVNDLDQAFNRYCGGLTTEDVVPRPIS